jgi:hypothetical protein
MHRPQTDGAIEELRFAFVLPVFFHRLTFLILSLNSSDQHFFFLDRVPGAL